jgi:hypothetical protein
LHSDLSRCGWEALKLYFKRAVSGKEAVPGAVIAIQNFGDFLGFNPHLHVLISDGCFHENGMFYVTSHIDTGLLEQIFRHMVLKMLLSKGKISQDVIKKILKHIGMWEVKRKPSPRANAPPFIPDSHPIPSVDDYVINPDYPVGAYR